MAILRTVRLTAILLCLSTGSAIAQSSDTDPKPAPNVPPPGEPRAQEQLPEAPPEEILKKAPPLEKKDSEASPDAAKPKPAPLPNTLPPAQKIEPKVPNT